MAQSADILPISVVIPYRNEAPELQETLDLIQSQLQRPGEVIMVNSASTDHSFSIVDEWIRRNHSVGTHYHNIDLGTNTPASSKNVGIKKARYSLIAFMDCGLNFAPDWLSSQYAFLKEHQLDCVFGVCHYQGLGIWDSCAVALTTGINVDVPAMPSSLCNKIVFDQTGYFLENRRAGYDVEWRYQLFQTKFKTAINFKSKVYHRKYNFASGPIAIFRKCYVYTIPSVGLSYYKVGNKYLGLIFMTAMIAFLMPSMLNAWILFYLAFRSYVFTYLKAKNLKIYRDFPYAIVFLPLVAILIDVGRTCGLLVGYYNYYIRKQKFATASEVTNY